MSETEKILPCPYCNSIEHIHIRRKGVPERLMISLITVYSVACLKCKVSSEETMSEYDAISAWNEQVNNGQTIKMKKCDENYWWNKKINKLEENHG